jgi:hypothetical protein
MDLRKGMNEDEDRGDVDRWASSRYQRREFYAASLKMDRQNSILESTSRSTVYASSKLEPALSNATVRIRHVSGRCFTLRSYGRRR